MSITNATEQRFEVVADQKPYFARLVKHLWRGGEYACFSQMIPHPDKKASWRQTWFPVEKGKRIPNQYNVYFSVYPVHDQLGEWERGTIANVASIGGLFAEFDLKSWQGEGELLDHIQAFSPKPNVINASGGGYHVFWLMQEPVLITDDNRESIRELLHAWVKLWGGDDGAKDLRRVLRVPGTYNFKPDYPEPRLVTCVYEDYSVLCESEVLFDLARPFIPAKPVLSANSRIISIDHDQKRIGRMVNACLERLSTAGPGTRHTTLIKAGRFLGGMVGAGVYSEMEAKAVLEAVCHQIGLIAEDGLKTIQGDIQDGLDYGKLQPLQMDDDHALDRSFNQPLTAKPALPIAPKNVPTESKFFHAETEAALLGVWMDNGKFYLSHLWPCKSSDFYMPSHKVIAATLERMADKHIAIDAVSVSRELNTFGLLGLAGGQEYIDRLINKPSRMANALQYAQDIVNLAKRRDLYTLGQEIQATLATSTDDIELIAAQVQEKIFAQSIETTLKPTALSAALSVDMDRILNHMDGQMPEYVHFGHTDLDRLIIGLEPGDLMILAAIPGAGKSALSANWVLGWEALVCSLEMTNAQYTQRLISMASADRSESLPFARIREGNLHKNEWRVYAEVSNELANRPIYLDDTPGMTLSQLKALTRYHVRQFGIKLLVVDHLGLMQPENKKLSREQQISEISWGLKMLARELGIRVLALSQLNRDLYKRQDKRPQLSDLRDSGSLEQNSDIVAFIYRDDMFNENSECPNQAEVIIAKQRNGSMGSAYLYYEKGTLRFKNAMRKEINLQSYRGHDHE